MILLRRRAALASAALLTLACDDEVRAPFDLDRIDESTESCVRVIHESLDLGDVLHQYVADAPGSAGGWALVTLFDEQLDSSELALVRVPASPDEPQTAAIGLGSISLNSARATLRAGVLPGELWLLLDWGSSALLRKLAPGVGAVVTNTSIGNFPVNEGVGCPNQFNRQLLLIEGDPFVLALPDCSDSTALEMQLLELDPDSLQFTTSWLLIFDPCANDPMCGLAAPPYTLGQIRGGESTHVANTERVSVGFTKVREFFDWAKYADVSLLQLWLTANGPEAQIITFEDVWLAPNLGPTLLAQDLFSIQLHVRNGGSDAGLFRFDREGELYIQVRSPLLPLDGRGRLVQLDSQSAIIDVHDGALEAVPLVDVAAWPSWEPRTLLELDDLIDFAPAGLGQLLLRREQAAPQIVQLRCLGQ